MKKYNLQYIIRYCKHFSKQAGWNPTETDFTDNSATLTLAKEDIDGLNSTPQTLVKDLLILMSATTYTIDDAVIAGDTLFLKVAPLPAGSVKKEVCTVAIKRQSIFNLTTKQPERSKHHA